MPKRVAEGYRESIIVVTDEDFQPAGCVVLHEGNSYAIFPPQSEIPGSGTQSSLHIWGGEKKKKDKTCCNSTAAKAKKKKKSTGVVVAPQLMQKLSASPKSQYSPRCCTVQMAGVSAYQSECYHGGREKKKLQLYMYLLFVPC